MFFDEDRISNLQIILIPEWIHYFKYKWLKSDGLTWCYDLLYISVKFVAKDAHHGKHRETS